MKFGIIGRNWGRNYARILNKMGYDFRLANKKNANEVIKWADCVIIASPTKTHLEYIKKARDKHILVEKPMVMSLKEAMQIKPKKTFMVGHQYLYNDSLPKLKKIEIKLRYPIWWEIAPHAFSLADFSQEAKIDVGVGRKYRKFIFNGKPWRDNPKKEPLQAELEHFINCIKTGKKPLTDLKHGLRVIKNMEKYEKKYSM